MLKVILVLDLKKNLQEDYKMKNFNHYILFADLLRYPSKDYPKQVEACQKMLDEKYPEVAMEMKRFTEYVNTHNEDQWQELFTKSFDVQPICYLDLGYVIFGEDYKRGAFLLHMQEEQLKAKNDCGTDLSDNICNMLTLYTKTDDYNLLDELAVKIMIPGVEKMVSEFAQARVELKMKVLKKLHKAIIQEELNQGNVYKDLLISLLLVFKKDFENVNFDKAKDPMIDIQHHKSFFGKQSVNNLASAQVKKNEINNLVNEYNLD